MFTNTEVHKIGGTSKTNQGNPNLKKYFLNKISSAKFLKNKHYRFLFVISENDIINFLPVTKTSIISKTAWTLYANL